MKSTALKNDKVALRKLSATELQQVSGGCTVGYTVTKGRTVYVGGSGGRTVGRGYIRWFSW